MLNLHESLKAQESKEVCQLRENQKTSGWLSNLFISAFAQWVTKDKLQRMVRMDKLSFSVLF